VVLATHVIFSAYGFWLPNDPRGSWSDFVAAWELVRSAGPATKISTHESVAAVEHDRAARLDAKRALRYPPVEFEGRQALSVSRGFARAIAESQYRVHACSILPAHVHLVIARHAHRARQIAGHLKTRARRSNWRWTVCTRSRVSPDRGEGRRVRGGRSVGTYS